MSLGVYAGRTLKNRYRLLIRVGAGGFSSVYLAQDIQAGTIVAVKVLHEHLSSEGKYVRQFLKEAEKVAKLHHPHIVRILDQGEEQGLFFLVMEYVQGKTLNQILLEQKKLHLPQALSILSQVAQALQEAERMGIVHQDIKPQNLMLTPDGEVKVMDFGIARDLTGTTLSTTGFLAFTPRYASPEQMEGRKDVDVRSDLYSLGVVLYEMLVGALPFPGDTPLEIIRQIERNPFPPLPAWLPGWIQQMLHKLLAPHREERYQHAQELLADLGAARVLQPRRAQSILAPTEQETEVVSWVPAAPVPKTHPVKGKAWIPWTVAGGAAAVMAVALIVFILASSPESKWRDDFTGSTIDSRWSITGNGTVTQQEGFLTINAKPTSDLAPWRYNLPRLSTTVSGDFIAETKVDGVMNEDTRGASLFVWVDEKNFLRLDRMSRDQPLEQTILFCPAQIEVRGSRLLSKGYRTVSQPLHQGVR